MTLTHARRRALHPQPWDGDTPATHLTDPALALLELVRRRGDLGRHYARTHAARALGLDTHTIARAETELRASVWGGAFRPRSRRAIPRSTRVRVYERDNWACVHCKSRNQQHHTLGHITPYARGGTDHHTNLRTECQPCNTNRADTETRDDAPGPSPPRDDDASQLDLTHPLDEELPLT